MSKVSDIKKLTSVDSKTVKVVDESFKKDEYSKYIKQVENLAEELNIISTYKKKLDDSFLKGSFKKDREFLRKNYNTGRNNEHIRILLFLMNNGINTIKKHTISTKDKANNTIKGKHVDLSDYKSGDIITICNIDNGTNSLKWPEKDIPWWGLKEFMLPSSFKELLYNMEAKLTKTNLTKFRNNEEIDIFDKKQLEKINNELNRWYNIPDKIPAKEKELIETEKIFLESFQDLCNVYRVKFNIDFRSAFIGIFKSLRNLQLYKYNKKFLTDSFFTGSEIIKYTGDKKYLSFDENAISAYFITENNEVDGINAHIQKLKKEKISLERNKNDIEHSKYVESGSPWNRPKRLTTSDYERLDKIDVDISEKDRDIIKEQNKLKYIKENYDSSLKSIKDDYENSIKTIIDKYSGDKKSDNGNNKKPLTLSKTNKPENIYSDLIEEPEEKPLDEKDKIKILMLINNAILGSDFKNYIGDIDGIDNRGLSVELNKSKLNNLGIDIKTIEKKIDKIRNKYNDLFYPEISDILKKYISYDEIIYEELKYIIYKFYEEKFNSDIEERTKVLNKYIKYGEDKFINKATGSIFTRGLKKRIINAGLGELLQVILMVTYREYNKKKLPSLKGSVLSGSAGIGTGTLAGTGVGATIGTSALTAAGVGAAISSAVVFPLIITLGITKGLDKVTSEIIGDLNRVPDENIKKLLFSLEIKPHLKEEIISVNKNLEPLLMEFIKQLKQDDIDKERKEKEKQTEKEKQAEKEKREQIKKAEVEKKKAEIEKSNSMEISKEIKEVEKDKIKQRLEESKQLQQSQQEEQGNQEAQGKQDQQGKQTEDKQSQDKPNLSLPKLSKVDTVEMILSTNSDINKMPGYLPGDQNLLDTSTLNKKELMSRKLLSAEKNIKDKVSIINALKKQIDYLDSIIKEKNEYKKQNTGLRLDLVQKIDQEIKKYKADKLFLLQQLKPKTNTKTLKKPQKDRSKVKLTGY